MGSSLVLLCNFGLVIINLNYGYQYLHDLYSELSDICFMIRLRYRYVLTLRYHPVPVMVNILALELWKRLQYLYVCSSMMSVHLEGGGFAQDTRVSLSSVDVVSRLVKCCWMSPFPTVCRGSRCSRPLLHVLAVNFSK